LSKLYVGQVCLISTPTPVYLTSPLHRLTTRSTAVMRFHVIY